MGRGRRVGIGGMALLASVSLAGLSLAGSGWARGPEPLPSLANGAAWRLTPGESSPSGAPDEAWLAAGVVPGTPEHRQLVSQALLDLRDLQQDNGAVAAGPASIWAYAWPRDSAFVAPAFAATGHLDEAWRVFDFLAGVQLHDGGFEARYLLDGSGVPDDRQRQADGAGWVLWSLDLTRTLTGEPLPERLWPLRDRATDFVLGVTDHGRRLPPAGPDYWEVRETAVTLGTVTVLAAGLEASARLYGADRPGGQAPEASPSGAADASADRAATVAGAAARLRSLVATELGPGYERYGDWGGPDAATAWLLPPFAEDPDEDAVAAWRAYQRLAARPSGGLAPGAAWKQDGISWTPETALVAWTAAARGEREVAEGLLDWLASHRTSWGSLPEKVRPDGLPAGPAPLAWTAALVVLTEHVLQPGASR